MNFCRDLRTRICHKPELNVTPPKTTTPPCHYKSLNRMFTVMLHIEPITVLKSTPHHSSVKMSPRSLFSGKRRDVLSGLIWWLKNSVVYNCRQNSAHSLEKMQL